MTTPSPGEFAAFAAQAGELEAHIAEAEARGEAVPAEARAMLEALRSIARAVDDLHASLAGGDPGAGPGDAPAAPAAPADPSPE